MRVVWSILASVVAVIVFVLVWLVSDFALEFIDTLRGNQAWFHGLLRSLLAPGIGAYVAMLCVARIFKSCSRWAVLLIFSAVLLGFTAWSLGLMILVARQAGFGTYQFTLQALTPVVAIVAAYTANTRTDKITS